MHDKLKKFKGIVNLRDAVRIATKTTATVKSEEFDIFVNDLFVVIKDEENKVVHTIPMSNIVSFQENMK